MLTSAEVTLVGGRVVYSAGGSPIPSDMRSATTPPRASARSARTRTDVCQFDAHRPCVRDARPTPAEVVSWAEIDLVAES
jgi:hypothetical protein